MTVQEQGNRQPALSTLETERLLLRQWSLADLDAIVAMNADPAVYRYLDEPEEPAAERALTRERILADYPPGLGAWSIFAREDPAAFLGYVHLIPIDAESDLSFANVDPDPSPEALDDAARRIRDALRAAGHGAHVPD